MERYLKGVLQGCIENNYEVQIVKPIGKGFIAKYVKYPFLAWRTRNKPGRHLIISERYSYLLFFLKKSRIVICHDLHTLYPEAETSRMHRVLYKFFLNAMSRADKLVCVSLYTKNDLLQYCPQFSNSNKLGVIHNGIEEFWISDRVNSSEAADWFPLFDKKKVLLSVGTDAWYKNNLWSLKLLKTLDSEFHLLRVGDFNSKNEEFIKKTGLENRITQVSDLSDEHLKWAYENAEYLLFPSISEGFGWPSLEAVLCGCAIVVKGLGVTSEIFPDKHELILLEEAKDCIESSERRVPTPKYHTWTKQVRLLLD